MEGAALRRQREIDGGIITAWHTAMFVLSGYAGNLRGKSLSDYLTSTPERPKSNNAQAIHFFHSLRARGVDVKIEKTKLN